MYIYIYIYNSQEHNIKTKLLFSVSFSNKIYIICITTFHWFPLIPRKNKLVPILPEEREDLPGEGDTEPAEMMVPSKTLRDTRVAAASGIHLGRVAYLIQMYHMYSYVCCIWI